MTVLFKVPPVAIDGDIVALEAKSYGAVVIAPGDRVFRWWSETQGGRGLAGYGICMSAQPVGAFWRAEIEAVTNRTIGFGKAALAPFRDAPVPRPEATLSAKLYRHSLNKVVQITPAEEAFLMDLIA